MSNHTQAIERNAMSNGGNRRIQPTIPEGKIMSLHRSVKSSIAALALITAGFSFIAPANADAVADIQAAGVLNVGVFADFPPFSSASSDMSLKGYDMDVAQAIADALKVKLNPVAVTGQNRIPYLNDHRVDLLMSVGYSDERAEVIAYAAAYAPYYIAVIGPAATDVKEAADLAGKSIAVNKGTLEDTSLTEAAPEGTDIKRFDNYNSVIQAFISGQTDLMVVGNDVGAKVLAKQEAIKPEQKFQLLSSPSHIGLNKGEDALKTAINETIAKMIEDGSLNTSSQNWLKVDLNPENLKD